MTVISEDVVKDILVKKRGRIEMNELVHHFADILNNVESGGNAKQELKCIANKFCNVQVNSNTKTLVLKEKYKKQWGLTRELDADGLSVSILRALNFGSPTNTGDEAVSPDFDLVHGDSVNSGNHLNDDSLIVRTRSASNLTDVAAVAPEMTPVTISVMNEGLPVCSPANPPSMNGDDDIVVMRPLSEVIVGSPRRSLSEPVLASPVPPEFHDEFAAIEAKSHASTPSKETTFGIEPDDAASSDSVSLEGSNSRQGSRATTPAMSLQPRMSVKESAKVYNQLAATHNKPHGRSMSPLASPAHRSSVTSLKGKRMGADKENSDETGSIASITVSSTERTWLTLSSSCDYHAMAKLLQSDPALASYDNFVNGWTALHWASRHGKPELVKLLAGRYRVDVNRRTGYTALHLAAMHDHLEVMNLLVDVYGASKQIRDNSGRLAEHMRHNRGFTRKVDARTLASLKRSDNAGRIRMYRTANLHGVYPMSDMRSRAPVSAVQPEISGIVSPVAGIEEADSTMLRRTSYDDTTLKDINRMTSSGGIRSSLAFRTKKQRSKEV